MRALFLLVACCVFALTGYGQDATGKTSLLVISNPDKFKSTVKKDTNNNMVPVCGHVSPCYTDFKYTTDHNFTKKVLYKNPVAYLRLPAAKALAAANEELKKKGYAIKIFDAYRPYSVTVYMWKLVPDERYTANPAKGSGHNRGAAVDVTIFDLKTGKELVMPTAYDDFSEKAHHDYMNLPKEAIANRELLKSVMIKHGFEIFPTEWWHYNWPGMAEKFDVLDLSFEQLKALQQQDLELSF